MPRPCAWPRSWLTVPSRASSAAIHCSRVGRRDRRSVSGQNHSAPRRPSPGAAAGRRCSGRSGWPRSARAAPRRCRPAGRRRPRRDVRGGSRSRRPPAGAARAPTAPRPAGRGPAAASARCLLEHAPSSPRRQALSAAVAFGRPSLASLASATAPQPAAGSRKWWTSCRRDAARPSGRAVGTVVSQPRLATCAGVQVSRRAPISELPRRRCRPNHGARRPGHGVEPQRDLGQLDGGGVEVDAVAVVQGEVGLHLLQLARVLRPGRSACPARPAGGVRYSRGELVDRLDEERPGAERRLADRQVAGSRAAVVVCRPGRAARRASCVTTNAGQHLGRVVRGADCWRSRPASRKTNVARRVADPAALAGHRVRALVTKSLSVEAVGLGRPAPPTSPWPGRRPWRPRTGRSSAKKPV